MVCYPIARLVQLQNLGYLDDSKFREDMEVVVHNVSYSDWMILYYLAQSMDKKNFAVLVEKLADDVRNTLSLKLSKVDQGRIE
jgi:hypothetical protein